MRKARLTGVAERKRNEHERGIPKHLDPTLAGPAETVSMVWAAGRRRVCRRFLLWICVAVCSRSRGVGVVRGGDFGWHRACRGAGCLVRPLVVLLAQLSPFPFRCGVPGHVGRSVLRRGKLAWAALLEQISAGAGSAR